jgi:hypothetical protein
MHHTGSRTAMAALCLWNLATLGPQVMMLQCSLLHAPHLRRGGMIERVCTSHNLLRLSQSLAAAAPRPELLLCMMRAVSTRRQPADVTTTVAAAQQQPAPDCSRQKLSRTITSAWQCMLGSWSTYAHQPALPAGLACGMLHLTVMHMGAVRLSTESLTDLSCHPASVHSVIHNCDESCWRPRYCCPLCCRAADDGTPAVAWQHRAGAVGLLCGGRGSGLGTLASCGNFFGVSLSNAHADGCTAAKPTHRSTGRRSK